MGSEAPPPPLPEWASEPCIMSIDEAGRGPVLGPMVYGCLYCALSYQKTLSTLSFAGWVSWLSVFLCYFLFWYCCCFRSRKLDRQTRMVTDGPTWQINGVNGGLVLWQMKTPKETKTLELTRSRVGSGRPKQQ